MGRGLEWLCTDRPAGQYEVFAWWAQFTYSMAQQVPYEIHHAGGVATVRCNQGTNGGKWNSLGTYRFNAGALKVQIHNGASAPGTYVVGDAVRFVYRGP